MNIEDFRLNMEVALQLSSNARLEYLKARKNYQNALVREGKRQFKEEGIFSGTTVLVELKSTASPDDRLTGIYIGHEIGEYDIHAYPVVRKIKNDGQPHSRGNIAIEWVSILPKSEVPS